MKPVRWSSHALQSLEDRGIDRLEADKTVDTPERIIPARTARQLLVRRYQDMKLNQEMALCVLLEESATERIVVTLYKTSQLKKYLEGNR